MSFSDSDLDLDDDGVLREPSKDNAGDGMVMDDYGIIHDGTDLFGHFEPTQRTDSGLGVDRRSTSTGKLTDFNLQHDARPSQLTSDMNDSHPLDEKSLNISDFEDSTARDSLKEDLALEHVSFSSQEEPELVFNCTRDTQNTSIPNSSHFDGSHFQNGSGYQLKNEALINDLKNQGVFTEDDFNLENQEHLRELREQGIYSEGDFDNEFDLKNQGVITDDDSHPLYSHSLLEFEKLESNLVDDYVEPSEEQPIGEDPLADYLHKTPRRDSSVVTQNDLTFDSSHLVPDEHDDVGHHYMDDHSHRSSPEHQTSSKYSVEDDCDDGRQGLNTTVIENRTLQDGDLNNIDMPDSFSRHSTPQPSKIPLFARQSPYASPAQSRTCSPAVGSRRASPSPDFKSRVPVRSLSPAVGKGSRKASPSPEPRGRGHVRSYSPAMDTESRRESPSPEFKSRVPVRSNSPAIGSEFLRRSPRHAGSASPSPDGYESRIPVRSNSRQNSQSPTNRSVSPRNRLPSPVKMESRAETPDNEIVSYNGNKRYSYSNNRPRSRSASRSNTPENKRNPESRSQSPHISISRRGSNEVSDIFTSNVVSSLNGIPKNSDRSSSVPVRDEKTEGKSSRPSSARLSKDVKLRQSESSSLTKLKLDMPKFLANRPESPHKLKIKVPSSGTARDSKLKPVRATQSSQEFTKEKLFSLSQSFSENEDQFSLSQLSALSQGDLPSKLRKERGQRQQTDELVNQLQDEYDKLLEKYALAEVTIDQLKLGAKIRLHSDPPTPAQATKGVVSAAQKSQLIHMPTRGQAQVGHIGQAMQGQLLSTPPGGQTPTSSNAAVGIFPSHHQSFSGSLLGGDTSGNLGQGDNSLALGEGNPLLTATTSGECAKIALIFQAKSLEEQLDSFKTLMDENQLTVDEQEKVYDRIKTDFEKLQHDYRQAREDHERMRRQNALSSGGSQVFFDDDKSLEGGLFKLGMKLEEVHERVEDNLHEKANRRLPFQEAGLTHSDSCNSLKVDTLKLDAGAGNETQKKMPVVSNGDQVSDLDHKVERLLDEYNALMSRYNDLKGLPPTLERDKEIDSLLKRLHEISAESPQLLNVRLPEILPARPDDYNQHGSCDQQSDGSRGQRVENHEQDKSSLRSDRHSGDEQGVISSAHEDNATHDRSGKTRPRLRKANTTQQNTRSSHSSIPDSGISTPPHSRKSVPRSTSRATTDGDSGFIGSESSRQSGNQAKGKYARLRPPKSSLKATELSSVTSNQQEWSETDVSTTESVKHETEQRHARVEKLRATQEPMYSRSSTPQGGTSISKKRPVRAATPDTEKSYVTQGSRATSRSSVKSERLKQLQDQIEQLRLEVQQNKQPVAKQQPPPPDRATTNSKPMLSATQKDQQYGYDVRDGGQKLGTQQGQLDSLRVAPSREVEERSGRHYQRENYEGSPLDDKYLRGDTSGSLRAPPRGYNDPYQNNFDSEYYDEDERFGGRGSWKHEPRPAVNTGRDGYSRRLRQPGVSDLENGRYHEKYRGGNSKYDPEFEDELRGNNSGFNHREENRHPRSEYRDFGGGRTNHLPEDRRTRGDDSYSHPADRRDADRNTRGRDRIYRRDYYESTPKRRDVRRHGDYSEYDPRYTHNNRHGDESQIFARDRDLSCLEPSFSRSNAPPLSRADLGGDRDYTTTRTVNGVTLTKTPCPVCAGSGTHTHAELNTHRQLHVAGGTPGGETRYYHPQPTLASGEQSKHYTPVQPSGQYANYGSGAPPVQNVYPSQTPVQNYAPPTHPMPHPNIHQQAPSQMPVTTPVQVVPQMYTPTPVVQTPAASQAVLPPAPVIYQQQVHPVQAQPYQLVQTQPAQTLPAQAHSNTPSMAVYPTTPLVPTPQATLLQSQTPAGQVFTPASTVLTAGHPVVQSTPAYVTATPVQLVTQGGQTYIPVELQATPVASQSTAPPSTTPGSKVRYYVREYRDGDSERESDTSKRKKRSTKRKKRLDEQYSDNEIIVVDNRFTNPPLDDASRSALELKLLSERMKSSLRDELNKSVKYSSLAWSPL